MLNFVEFVLIFVVVIVGAMLIILMTGIVYNRNNYVSVIEKKHQFYKIENAKFSWFMPFKYRKVAYYPIVSGTIRVNKKKVTYQVIDVMKLYKTGKKVKTILGDEKNLEVTLEIDYGIKVLNVN